jgi:hypothetical protein
VSVEARQLVHLYLSTDQETFNSGTCRQRDWNVQKRHHAWEVQFLTNDQWHVSQEVRHVVFQESYVILPCKPAWKYVGPE